MSVGKALSLLRGVCAPYFVGRRCLLVDILVRSARLDGAPSCRAMRDDVRRSLLRLSVQTQSFCRNADHRDRYNRSGQHTLHYVHSGHRRSTGIRWRMGGRL